MLVMGIVVISVILALLRTVSLVFKQLVFYVLPAVGKALGIAALSTSILASKQLAIYGWLFVRLWQGAALPMLLFLGGLQAIPSELYEAWGIDCANALQQFKSITVPYLIRSPGPLLILFPIYITLPTTFKTASESSISFFTLPNSLFLVNYISVLQDQKLYYAYGSTLLTTAMPLVGELILLPPMGYALSRSMGRSKVFRGLYFFFLMGIFLPWQGRMMPLVKLISWLNLLSPPGVTLLDMAHATCESMFLYVGYLATVSTHGGGRLHRRRVHLPDLQSGHSPADDAHPRHRGHPRGPGHLERFPAAADHPEPLLQAVDADHLSEQLLFRVQR